MGASAPGHDVVVVGAGPAGMMAALCAARRGRSVLLLEKNRQPGLKILISGGGRCNLTTTRSGADLEAQYGAVRGRFLRHALRSFPPQALRELVEAAGLPLREEDLEKLFPVSQSARDVRDLFVRLCQEAGVALRTGCPVREVVQAAGPRRFAVRTVDGMVVSDSVVLATGGLSYPKTGATGDGYAMAAAFGHGLVPTVPALAPLWLETPWLRELQGIVLHGVQIAVLDPAGRILLNRTRPILITHRGLSGPAPMDLAGDLEELHGAGRVSFDFAPGQSREELDRMLQAAAAAHGARAVVGALPEHLPERLRAALVALVGAAGPLAALTRVQRQGLVAALKDLRLPVPKSLGFDHAEVTRGGVPLAEVDPRTMQSRRVPGLFVCGELLDVDGPIGGFNFQAAFATGRLAGLTA
ncbi:MAG: NAD(P)/FAD-dependent oxidoreductase [Planctomycetes bacterium]|nr:NAD(P)/FAD-dependent oxidoreductase [Planctomycetota bacterium]